MRYSIAFLFLLIWGLRSKKISEIKTISRSKLGRLIFTGDFILHLDARRTVSGISIFPAVTVNLLLAFTSIVVALLGFALLGEYPKGWQWFGVTLSIAGAVIFLSGRFGCWCNHQLYGGSHQRIGNRRGEVSPLNVTIVSMGIGGILLLVLGIGFQGMPDLDWQSWLIILWLALINTAFAFTLWNLTLKTLPAMESSIINNTMMIQIPVLAVLLLGESLTMKELAGMMVAGMGVLIVQVSAG